MANTSFFFYVERSSRAATPPLHPLLVVRVFLLEFRIPTRKGSRTQSSFPLAHPPSALLSKLVAMIAAGSTGLLAQNDNWTKHLPPESRPLAPSCDFKVDPFLFSELLFPLSSLHFEHSSFASSRARPKFFFFSRCLRSTATPPVSSYG